MHPGMVKQDKAKTPSTSKPQEEEEEVEKGASHCCSGPNSTEPMGLLDMALRPQPTSTCSYKAGPYGSHWPMSSRRVLASPWACGASTSTAPCQSL
eukprot:scaffold325377_cov31-Prasinocladus_malaysianus.AAC.1